VKFFNKRIAVLGLLGFSSGLPLALSDSTMQAWLAESDVDIATIGLFSLVGLPYVLKFLWAPVLDRFQLKWLSRRRDWIIFSQLVIAILLFAASEYVDAHQNTVLLGIVAFLIAFASATQDIAIDAYRAEILLSRERGMGAGVSVAGYRIGMLLSGAGAFVLADQIGFSATYAVMGGFMLLATTASIFGPPIQVETAPPQTLAAAIVEPLKNYFDRRAAITILLLVVLYKLGDAFAGRLTTTFLLRGLEFSLTDVGTINKGLGLAASIFGALYGGFLMFRIGMYRALMYFAILQAVTNLGFMFLAFAGKTYVGLIAVIGLENICGGMGTSAFVAFLMAICDRRYTAAQFALLTAFASLGRVLAGPPSGYLVESVGWGYFFGFTFLVSLPAIALLFWMRERIMELDNISANETGG
jgi:PAT family beta-lactamase induction signal transducer AmpG